MDEALNQLTQLEASITNMEVRARSMPRRAWLQPLSNFCSPSLLRLIHPVTPLAARAPIHAAARCHLLSLQETLGPLLGVDGSYRDCADHLDPRQYAQLQAAVAFVLNSSYFMYLRTRGVKTTSHPVRQDVQRIKEYFDKIAKAGAAEKEKGDAAAASGDQAGRKLDLPAAQRMIAHAQGSRLSAKKGNSKAQQQQQQPEQQER